MRAYARAGAEAEMWRDERQAARTLRALLGAGRPSALWTLDGPTDEAHTQRDVPVNLRSPRTHILLAVAWSLASLDARHSTLPELLREIDDVRIQLVARASGS